MVATSAEKIARQHEEAVVVVNQDGCEYHSEDEDVGEIPLSEKSVPTNGLASPWTRPVVSVRGRVDVSAMADLVRPGHDVDVSGSSSSSSSSDPNDLWDERRARVENVAVRRASHDEWGVRKIMLVFCDDFLRVVFEMPWWNDRFRRALAPVLERLGVPERRLVRALFTALPPGATIPVHHDTGAWVRRTHRVHVPVLVRDPTRVLFRVGPDDDRLRRVNAEPGVVFEMNNQARHAVSNCGTTHRVHLVLDYVDEDDEDFRRNVRRVTLDPGETLVQTRRTVDRARDKGKTQTPSFVILGAQKAGTTSLYEWIAQHPLVVKPKRRETHCLDWRWPPECNDDEKYDVAKARAHCQSFYHAPQLAHHPSLITGDSTPSYLLHTTVVVPRLKAVFPHLRTFFVCLRDPAARAVSHYNMVLDPNGTPAQKKARGATKWKHLSLRNVVEKELDEMAEDGLVPYWDAAARVVDEDAFRAFSGSNAERAAWRRFLERRVPAGVATGAHSLMARGMYAVQLAEWFDAFPSSGEGGGRFFVSVLERDHRDEATTRATLDRAFAFLGLPPWTVDDVSPRNARAAVDRDDDEPARETLRRFYAPHNARLARLLRERRDRESDDDDVDASAWADGEDPWPYGADATP